MSAPLTHGLIIGATSSLATALGRELARGGASLALCGRDPEELQSLAQDICIRHGVRTAALVLDAEGDPLPARELIEAAASALGALDFVVIALSDTRGDADDMAVVAHLARINYVVPAALMAAAAEYFAAAGGGSVALIGSVSGDRGRQSNYAYGSAKAAVAAFASGLRNRYAGRVHIMTVKVGWVDTPFAWNMKNPLVAPREAVARRIARAMRRRRDVLYAPGFWRAVMAVIVHIPEGIFKRMKL